MYARSGCPPRGGRAPPRPSPRGRSHRRQAPLPCIRPPYYPLSTSRHCSLPDAIPAHGVKDTEKISAEREVGSDAPHDIDRHSEESTPGVAEGAGALPAPGDAAIGERWPEDMGTRIVDRKRWRRHDDIVRWQ